MKQTAAPRLSDFCGHLLRRAQQWHNALWFGEVGDECTTPQFAVLAVLAEHPGIDQRRLAEFVSLDSSSAADVVVRLTAKGWIIRRRDSADARRNLLALSGSASLTLARLAPISRRVQDTLFAPLPLDAHAEMMSGLACIARIAPDAVASAPLNAPGHFIRVAQQVHTSLWAEEFGDFLTAPQFAALHVLAGSPWISQRQLAGSAGLDPSTAADIVARLVKRGWVVRRRDPADGRGRLLALGDDAGRLPRELWPRVLAVHEALLAPVPASGRALFLDRLARVAYRGAAVDAS